jgi:crotonobetainyl-CoA:carnitine CoA-transferase CaiB-like acyl-CoA transferase
MDLSDPTGPDRPLAGFAIVEISTRVAGSYCGWLLAQLGATVRRVAAPTVIDCPPDLKADVDASLHELKQEVPVDDPALPKYLADCDVVIVDSLHDDALDGVGRDLTRELLLWAGAHTAVIDIPLYVIPGSGPIRAEAATSLTASALSSMSWSIGHVDQAPLTLPHDIPEFLTGAEAAAAAALSLVMKTADPAAAPEWQIVTSEVLTYYAGQICSNFLPYERPWHRDGPRATQSGGSYPAAMFECLDGWISIMCRKQKEWHALLAAMGNPEWSQDPRFADSREVARLYADEADRHLKAWTSERTRVEMAALGREFSFPIAPVLRMEQALEQEQIVERRFLHPSRGIRLPGVPWHMVDGAGPGNMAERPLANRRRASPVGGAAPLAGLRVLDLSWAWSGPMVTSGLCDLGAEVLKVENLTHADPTRVRGRATRGGVPIPGPEHEVTPYFNQLNHAKRSIAVDISTPGGVEAVRRLAGEVDVVVENMRPGALERKGLGYFQLIAENPSLIMLSMSIVGQTGPLRELGGYAPVMSGLAGLDSIVGYSADDLIGLFNPSLGDPDGAVHGLLALLAALARRELTGHGCWIDLAQVEALLGIQRTSIIVAQRRGSTVVPANGHHLFWPHGTWRASGSDNWLALAARTNAERARLAAHVGLPAVPSPADFDAAVAEWVSAVEAEAAARDLRAIGLPAAKVRPFEEVVDTPDADARGIYSWVEHPYLGQQRILNLPWRLSGRTFPARGCAPLFGADTKAILGTQLDPGRPRSLPSATP